MKVYRPTRELLAEVDRVLAENKPSFHNSPLENVIELLCRGRHYTWMGIYLAVDSNESRKLLGSGHDAQPGEIESPETRTKILVSMKLGGREVGLLDVESDRENAFGPEDRVLLENVATRLARFLTGRGKYIVGKARKQDSTPGRPTAKARRPKSESRDTFRSAAVGEK